MHRPAKELSDDYPFLNARPRYVLTLVPLPGVNAIRALRWILKSVLRQHGMRCVDIGMVDHVLDLNRAILSAKPLNQLINELIEAAEPPSPNYRQYLGASSIGAECLRRVQYDWMCDPQFPARTRDIFAARAFLRGAFSPAPDRGRI